MKARLMNFDSPSNIYFKAPMGFLQLFFTLTLGATGLLADTTIISGCEKFLSGSKSYERIMTLHPELLSVQNPASKVDLLVALKTEIWSYLPHGSIPWKNKKNVPQIVLERMKKQFDKIYRFDQMNSDDIYLFYANQLNSIYFLALREWMDDLISSQDIKMDRKVALSLLSRNYPSSSLFSATLTPEITEEILKGQDWDELLKALYEDKDALKRAHETPGFHNPCCLTTPGCLLCPNNRAWLK